MAAPPSSPTAMGRPSRHSGVATAITTVDIHDADSIVNRLVRGLSLEISTLRPGRPPDPGRGNTVEQTIIHAYPFA